MGLFLFHAIKVLLLQTEGCHEDASGNVKVVASKPKKTVIMAQKNVSMLVWLNRDEQLVTLLYGVWSRRPKHAARDVFQEFPHN